MKVFISGPVTGHPDYKEKFAAVELYLGGLGYLPLNPAKILDLDSTDDDTNVEHLSKYQEIMNNCYELIDECDAIFHMHGWKHSHGCEQEHRYGVIKGKIFMYQDDMTL